MGRRKGSPNPSTRITALRLYTNRGPDLEGHSKDRVQFRDGFDTRVGIGFESLKLVHFDPLLVNAHIKGLCVLTTKTRINSVSGTCRLALM